MDTNDAPVLCPFCHSNDTELFSLFGQQLLTVQYYCNTCRTPFERVKGKDILPDARLHAHADGEVEGKPE
jgi:hypothetical protein